MRGGLPFSDALARHLRLFGRLHHTGLPLPGQANTGVRLRLDLGELSASELTERCPVADDTGKLAPGRLSGLWNA